MNQTASDNLLRCAICPAREIAGGTGICAGEECGNRAALNVCPAGLFEVPRVEFNRRIRQMPGYLAPEPIAPEVHEAARRAQVERENAFFHAMWDELHARPRLAPDLAREMDWLREFAGRLPCGDCRRDFLMLLDRTPPELRTRWSYFAWTVLIHNAINARLAKAVMSLAEAASLHGYEGPEVDTGR